MHNIYFQNHVVTIAYEPEWELGTAQWQGFLSSAEFRKAVTQCLQLIEEYKPLRWLGDNRKMKVIRQADQDWFAVNALPRLQASTIRRHATVVSEDIFNKMAVEQIIRRVENPEALFLKEFNSKQLALAWLKQPTLVSY
ncbi:STAS/SEC14 domain-containing protein [Adhaeribacter pallidiroseus]|uniref:STAS/SEC14 domain-containing protein n=1 Tax=Adhaeribacter pallidiroseus TaxID=2072847 RepID=A0A369QML3_9BACT|nr:STAS/SEC14 domain-containing protein [Adhaeribacter pallidiroseus]RDC66163.1 hypothetical protein AHMF7616_04794 [Adhaeribacter pallidiroseus]